MIKSSILIFTVFAFVSFSKCGKSDSTPQLNGQETFANPVWEGADPWMVKQGDDYIYCYSVNNSIVLSKSKKMTQKGAMKNIWTAPASGWNRACVWAPEIHFINNRWFVYYAAGDSGPPFIHQRTGVLRSKTEDVFSDYEDMGVLYTGDTPSDPSTNVWAIDMTILEHKGKLYAIWSGWIKQQTTDATPQHLYISEMENPSTMKGKRVQLSSPIESWETGGPLNLNEGAQILKKDDQVFVIYSCRESWLVEYRQGMLQLINPDGDLLDPANWRKTGPVFQGNSQVHGVGHCSFVKSPDNSEDWIIYHSKKNTSPGWERDVRMQPFRWKADGTPDFGEPIPAGQQLNLPSGESKLEGLQVPSFKLQIPSSKLRSDLEFQVPSFVPIQDYPVLYLFPSNPDEVASRSARNLEFETWNLALS